MAETVEIFINQIRNGVKFLVGVFIGAFYKIPSFNPMVDIGEYPMFIFAVRGSTNQVQFRELSDISKLENITVHVIAYVEGWTEDEKKSFKALGDNGYFFDNGSTIIMECKNKNILQNVPQFQPRGTNSEPLGSFTEFFSGVSKAVQYLSTYKFQFFFIKYNLFNNETSLVLI